MSGGDVVALLNQVLSRLAVIEAKVGVEGGSSGSSESGSSLPPRIAAFDTYCANHLEPFVAAYTKLGGDAAAAGNNIREAWMELRAFLLMACHCKEPSQAALPSLLGGLGSKLQASKKFINKNEWENHTKALSEGIACLNWYVRSTYEPSLVNDFIFVLFYQGVYQACPSGIHRKFHWRF